MELPPIPRIMLRDGNAMPQLGYGTWQIPTVDAVAIVGAAIAAGHRSIDTAQDYGNEDGIGRAIRDSGVPLTEFFITSKLRNGAHARDLAIEAFEQTLRDLGVETLDMFLINWPVPAEDKYVEAWRTMVELQAQGRVHSIGVSNFGREHLERIIGETGVTPSVNQIELHPRLQQRDLRVYHQRRDIRLQSWSPLGPETGSTAWWSSHGRATKGSLFDDEVIKRIAETHRKTPAQVIIRWHLQEGLILFPRSVRPERIAENLDVFGFTLDAEDMYRIEALDSPQGRIGPDPNDWNVIS